jgi:hypothetical protein
MPFDYESLVGHLYIVGGRALSVTPPGALVEVAPKKLHVGVKLIRSLPLCCHQVMSLVLRSFTKAWHSLPQTVILPAVAA